MPREIISVQLGQCGNQSKLPPHALVGVNFIVNCDSWNGVLEAAVC